MPHAPMYRADRSGQAHPWTRRRLAVLTAGLVALAVLGSSLGRGFMLSTGAADDALIEAVQTTIYRPDLIAALRTALGMANATAARESGPSDTTVAVEEPTEEPEGEFAEVPLEEDSAADSPVGDGQADRALLLTNHSSARWLLPASNEAVSAPETASVPEASPAEEGPHRDGRVRDPNPPPALTRGPRDDDDDDDKQKRLLKRGQGGNPVAGPAHSQVRGHGSKHARGDDDEDDEDDDDARAAPLRRGTSAQSGNSGNSQGRGHGSKPGRGDDDEDDDGSRSAPQRRGTSAQSGNSGSGGGSVKSSGPGNSGGSSSSRCPSSGSGSGSSRCPTSGSGSGNSKGPGSSGGSGRGH